MIDYYGYITTMSWRAIIALEELGLPFRLHGVADLSVYPHLSRWYTQLRARPVVERALAVDRESGSVLPEYYRNALFDQA